MKKIDFIIIAIDGPSGVGKSTISSLIANRLNYFYVDTGAMFRCLAWNWERQGSPESKESLLELGNNTDIIFKNGNVICNGENLTDLIRSENISKLASKISIFPSIREVLKKKQRDLVEKISKSEEYEGAVLEGRDIGTVVFPKADFKFFLDANLEIRAHRRMIQLNQKGKELDFEEILRSIKKRDFRDKNRKLAPLKSSKDAIIIDTGKLTKLEVLDELLSKIL